MFSLLYNFYIFLNLIDAYMKEISALLDTYIWVSFRTPFTLRVFIISNS